MYWSSLQHSGHAQSCFPSFDLQHVRLALYTNGWVGGQDPPDGTGSKVAATWYHWLRLMLPSDLTYLDVPSDEPLACALPLEVWAIMSPEVVNRVLTPFQEECFETSSYTPSVGIFEAFM